MRKILLTVFILSAFTNARAQPFNPLLATMLQDTLDAYVAAIPNVKGMSAGVFVPGQGVWQGSKRGVA